MKGFPKYINTKQDLENIAKEFPNETIAYMQDIYNNRHNWFMVRQLNDDEAGVINDEFKVVENKSHNETEAVRRYQYQLMEDENGTIFRLGFMSSAEFEQFMKSIQPK